ncbi:PIN domain-containing protein [Lagierella sp.]|uniref:PIN/TRAM domain-containing protein n=1 Tax=Lagierella sp. TaxID=2849657 RepID=UPI0026344C18|nr:PIN domain-containing protein [Lagierella sp.]
MARRVVNLMMTLLGGIFGFTIVYLLDKAKLISDLSKNWRIGIYAIGIIIFSIVFYNFFPKMLKSVENSTEKASTYLKKLSISELVSIAIGMIIGLFVAFLISMLIIQIKLPFVGNVPFVIVSIVIYIALGYMGMKLGMQRFKESGSFFEKIKSGIEKPAKEITGDYIKILDTSVIIDGRIKDILEAGFIDGKIIIPIFVLEELQHIADSDNDLRRKKGRRGLDILNMIQNDSKLPVEVSHKRYREIKDVDSKLLQLAKDVGGKLVTNDYNLNKVAAVRKVEVLNINELANAMKPIVIPGEQMTVTIIKDGKESNQGLAYLVDGTMVVVEDGKRYIGKTVDTTVTSVLQTAAGKMIFVRIN